MKISVGALAKGTFWTVGAFGGSQLLRIASSVVLARLLAPEIFGTMVIIYSLRVGIELISDIGIVQSIVSNKNANEPEFFNTAWSLRLVRGAVLWGICLVLALPLAYVYKTPIIAAVLPAMGLAFILGGLGSLGPVFLQKELKVSKLNVFDLGVEAISTVGQIIFAYFNPTVWALVFGNLLAVSARAIGSYAIAPAVRHRFHISREYAKQILTFGKWIFLSSLVYFFSANFDRLYLGGVLSLQVLGVYGIARNLAEVLNTLVTRLNFVVIFPYIAAHAELPREELRRQLWSTRAIFLSIVAVGVSLFAATADLLITLLYDQRYHSAGWMLSVLAIGAWFSSVCTVNESTLLGFGKPVYGAIANVIKAGCLLVCLPLSMANYGLAGVIIVVALSEVARYVPILIGQRREQFSFVSQDVLLTLSLLAMAIFWSWMRDHLGLGTSILAVILSHD